MPIPKLLHFGLFGGYKATPLEERCIASWKKILPDYEIKFWNDENGPRHNRFFVECLRKNPVMASSYVRYWALYNFGGVFLDTDVEMVKPFDLSPQAFVGFQSEENEKECVNEAVIASEKGHWFPLKCQRKLDTLGAATCSPIYCGPGVVTETLRDRGMVGLGEQVVGGVKVCSRRTFYPFLWHDVADRSHIRNETISIHWWMGSWAPHLRHASYRDKFPDL